MRLFLRTVISTALVIAAQVFAIAAAVCHLVLDVGRDLFHVVARPLAFIPRLIATRQIARIISMTATSLVDRLVGGVRVHGFLGRPAVRMLKG